MCVNHYKCEYIRGFQMLCCPKSIDLSSDIIRGSCYCIWLTEETFIASFDLYIYQNFNTFMSYL